MKLKEKRPNSYQIVVERFEGDVNTMESITINFVVFTTHSKNAPVHYNSWLIFYNDN